MSKLYSMNSANFRLTALYAFLWSFVLVSCDNGSDAPPPNVDPPTIIGFGSDSLVAGETLVVEGINFSTVASENKVSFNGAETVAFLSSKTELQIEIPEGAKTGEITITIAGKSDISPQPLHILEDIPRKGLLFFLPFDLDANDVIGGRKANLQGATLTLDRFNNANSAYAFNGDDFIEYSNEGLHPLNGLTVSMWIYTPTFHHGWVLSNYDNSILGPGGYEFQLGGIDTQWISGLIGNYLGGGGNHVPMELAEWVNVTMTYDESTMDLWINGKLELESTNNRDLVIPYHSNLVLGASLRLLDGGFLFNGSLDDVAIYDRVLSESEIVQLHQQNITSKAVQTYTKSFPTDHPVKPTPDGPVLEDSEGNVYRVVTIGNQTWMADNLKSTKCSDGTELPNVADGGTWQFATEEPAYCWYNNDQVNMEEIYGALYNHYATLGDCNICPDGWHVPTIEEWRTLIEYLGGEAVAGEKLKHQGRRYWASNYQATDETGFSAVAGGARSGGAFTVFGWNGFYWSSSLGTRDTEDDSGQCIILRNNNGSISINTKLSKDTGLSVRCIQD